jgi:hypothetical protein
VRHKTAAADKQKSNLFFFFLRAEIQQLQPTEEREREKTSVSWRF